LLEEDGYWVRTAVKVNLIKAEKVAISKPSTPRPEIDIVAFNQKQNKLWLIEVKSYLDSPGVKYEDIRKETDVQEGRCKLLTSKKYRKIVSKRLAQELRNSGQINKSTQILFGLIAGKVYQNRETDIASLFEKRGWMFWGPSTIKTKLIELANKDYEDGRKQDFQPRRS
jgi:hypothetical protein